MPNGKRCPKRKGDIFREFVTAWRALGYHNVEWRERRAWKSGSGTIGNRLYMIMRRDDEPIVWPEPNARQSERQGRQKLMEIANAVEPV